ncbi:DUF2971 domain-containing protein [Campylobacter majalis]|uniref:DUF2971 domain-containing protein n=1 Tax=Campylobacter majalis TaxID=2790656 RepID=UPI003D69E543
MSQNFPKNCTNEHLLWAHYANSHKGIRIDFELDNKYEPKSVKYTDERIFIKSKQDAMNKMDEIMTTKLKCWKYERESRVISDIDKIKINIKQIMLGRGLLRANFEYKDKFDENIIEFAIKIKELINDNKVKILAYTSRYSNDFKEIL